MSGDEALTRDEIEYREAIALLRVALKEELDTSNAKAVSRLTGLSLDRLKELGGVPEDWKIKPKLRIKPKLKYRVRAQYPYSTYTVTTLEDVKAIVAFEREVHGVPCQVRLVSEWVNGTDLDRLERVHDNI